MERVIWVEIVGRHGVLHRSRFERLPLTIGRGYGNDVVLDDPHADALHARISRRDDGTLMVEDLGSVNGTKLDGRDGALLRGGEAPLVPGAPLRIGRTVLRVATADLAVPPAVPVARQDAGTARLLSSPRATLLVPLLGVVLMLYQAWLADAQNDSSSVIGFAVISLLLVAGWAGAWALAGRLAIHQARFRAHHLLAWAALVLIVLIDTARTWADYFTESDALGTVFYLAETGVAAALLYFHLGLASQLRPRIRASVTAGVLAGFTALLLLFDSVEEAYGTRELVIDASLKPAPVSWFPAGSIDDFLAGTVKLKNTVDELDDGE